MKGRREAKRLWTWRWESAGLTTQQDSRHWSWGGRDEFENRVFQEDNLLFRTIDDLKTKLGEMGDEYGWMNVLWLMVKSTTATTLV